MFIDFLSHKNNRHKLQAKTEWLFDWRSWCAKSKVYFAGAINNANKQTNSDKRNSRKDADRVDHMLNNPQANLEYLREWRERNSDVDEFGFPTKIN
jgi:hypothetical protein